MNHVDRAEIIKNTRRIIVFFVGPLDSINSTVRNDWIEFRSRFRAFVVVVTFYHPDDSLLEFAAESNISFVHYTDLDTIDEKCAVQTQLAAGQEDPPVFIFSGVVDRFDPPTYLSGWVKLFFANNLIEGLTINAFRRGCLLGSASPSHSRVDATGSSTYKAGFAIRCTSAITDAQFVAGEIHVRANDLNGNVYDVPVWPVAIEHAALRTIENRKGPQSDLSEIEKLVAPIKKTEAR